MNVLSFVKHAFCLGSSVLLQLEWTVNLPDAGEEPAILLKIKLHQTIIGIPKACIIGRLFSGSPELQPPCSSAVVEGLALECSHTYISPKVSFFPLLLQESMNLHPKEVCPCPHPWCYWPSPS